ncbi:MAG: two-component system, NarL family, invasion response regulator UvrY [Gaiellaceae bacterium]|nr:two-component system, NarL family, invasion response regulator UvrY [Gaiellaceae bacterium]
MTGTIVAIRPSGIEASSGLCVPLAEPCGLQLAAMRSREVPAKLVRMPIQCLLVDDNRDFLEAARTLLEREGLPIAAVASTSADALRKAELVGPDVVLVDVSLGDESGIDLARRLVADSAQEATVILISTRSEAELTDVIALSPAAGFLSKSDLSADAIRAFLD